MRTRKKVSRDFRIYLAEKFWMAAITACDCQRTNDGSKGRNDKQLILVD